MDDKTEESIKNIWQKTNEGYDIMVIDDIKSRVKKISNTVKWRNWREYGASLIIIIVFSYYIWIIENFLMKLGSLCIIFATIFIVDQLRRRSSITDINLGALSVIDFYRKQLEVERDLMQTVWLWYILPMLPGLALFIAGALQANPGASLMMYVSIIVPITVFVLLLNAWGARKMQKEIDALP
jgi:hypothetical protein